MKTNIQPLPPGGKLLTERTPKPEELVQQLRELQRILTPSQRKRVERIIKRLEDDAKDA